MGVFFRPIIDLDKIVLDFNIGHLSVFDHNMKIICLIITSRMHVSYVISKYFGVLHSKCFWDWVSWWRNESLVFFIVAPTVVRLCAGAAEFYVEKAR